MYVQDDVANTKHGPCHDDGINVIRTDRGNLKGGMSRE